MVDVSARLDVSNMCLLIFFQLVCASQAGARNADQAIKSYSLIICLQSIYKLSKPLVQCRGVLY